MTRRLVRDFIDFSLYDPVIGYFNKPSVIFSPPALLFKDYIGMGSYKKHVNSIYKESPGSWITPVELFKPHYARSLLEWVLSRSSGKPIHIMEIGGGTGTCALNILDALYFQHPNLYKKSKYTILEFAEKLSTMQTQRIKPIHNNFKSVCTNAGLLNENIATYLNPSENDIFVIGLEVLDNMSHDKIVIPYGHDQPYQVQVIPAETTTFSATKEPINYAEVLEPLSDPIIRKVFDLYMLNPKHNDISMLKKISNVFKRKKVSEVKPEQPYISNESDSIVYLPTTLYMFLERVGKYLPKANLLLADFSALPQKATIEGVFAPIVASKNPDIDHDSYLITPGKSDIFFPTDFELLKKMYKATTKKESEYLNHKEFLLKHCKSLHLTETRNGSNPMLEDYNNMSIFSTID